MTSPLAASTILPGTASGAILASPEALSFWGGVDPATGTIIDIHHPLHGQSVTGKILLMPSSRGSCTGSGVLLNLALNSRAPAALIFRETEDVLTLGALVAEIFGHALPVLRATPEAFAALSHAQSATITQSTIIADGLTIPLTRPRDTALELTAADQAVLDGADGPAPAQAMRILCAMAVQQGAVRLIEVTQAHIDGCIYASPANLTFARKMADLGGKVKIPTTMNAISVDHEHWRAQGTPEAFGLPAQRLADAYVEMGCAPTFTCAPYLLDTTPKSGDAIGWSESNAVIFANSILGARTAKHPDFLDLCIAITGRAPLSGVYLDAHRKARLVLDIDLPENPDSAVWPLIGYIAGQLAPDRIPFLTGLAPANPSPDDLKALCAAFGTTSAAPMLHIEDITPEAATAVAPDTPCQKIDRALMTATWLKLNTGPERIDLVAFGSPHASVTEARTIADALDARRVNRDVAVILTIGPATKRDLEADGTIARLTSSGVTVISDLCWCSISEPVFPPSTKTVLTDSGKYAHYGPGLSGRAVRLASLSDCITAALTAHAPQRLPSWLQGPDASAPSLS
ncbi:aconitase X [Pelagibacterium luteolum]|uniref:Predicted aconitase subunit 1 n=1 Tax=Pelagibacterium luteolum TaxID=440168 RepID=A0A1G7S4M6_9HYPH|nr:aconitase X [Pelagibacterium luteolum]SDG17966.1 predicted aconitase subunit 1 [Pelagibacterium luteolum]